MESWSLPNVPLKKISNSDATLFPLDLNLFAILFKPQFISELIGLANWYPMIRLYEIFGPLKKKKGKQIWNLISILVKNQIWIQKILFKFGSEITKSRYSRVFSLIQPLYNPNSAVPFIHIQSFWIRPIYSSSLSWGLKSMWEISWHKWIMILKIFFCFRKRLLIE